MRTSLTRKYLLVACLFLLTVAANGQSVISREYFQPYTNMGDIEVDVADDRLADLSSGPVNFADKTAYGIVAVGFDPDMNLCYDGPQTFKITVQVDETIISTPGMPTTGSNQYTLLVNYDPSMGSIENEQAYVVIPNARHLLITIVDVKSVSPSGTETPVTSPGSLPADLYVEGEIIRERYMEFDPADPASVPAFEPMFTLDPAYLEHNVHYLEWQNVDGAVEYEIEWTYVDDFWGNSLTDNKPQNQIIVTFKNNASSVRVKRKALNSFYIPAIYSRGYVVFRIRAIGRGGPTLDDDIFGNWSLADGNDLSSIAANNKRNSELVPDNFLYNGFNNLNAQYAVQFAEEGKLLASGTYADGSLRVRQNATAVKIDHAEAYGKMGLITETIYDHMGRAAVTTLPAVTKNGFWYTPNYNRNSSGDKFSYLDFDTDQMLDSGCVTAAMAMSTASGSARYYSDQNPGISTGLQGLVADARGFPFVQTVFERDNTNKPKVQSGVGETHKMGGGHETKYVYGGAEAVQLNRLFGTDAGYPEYYQKNMIIDANGQISITYTDMAGRTVATALAGEVPDNVNALRDSLGNVLAESGDTVVDDMLNISNNFPNGSANPLSVDGSAYTLSSTLTIDKEQDYIFTYSAELTDFQDSCFTFCLDCVYDLEISLTDECGNYLISNGDSVFTMTVGGNTDTLCTDSNLVTLPEFVVHLTPGSYMVYKRLSINEDSLAVFVEHMIQNSQCLKGPEDFYVAPDTSGCFITCESCMESIGTWEAFFTDEKIDSLFNGDSTLAHQTLWPVYLSMQNECDAICNPDNTRDFCGGIYRLMLMDMNPGGQYAQYADSAGIIGFADYPISVLNENNLLPIRQLDQFYPAPTGASLTVINGIVNQTPTWRRPVFYDHENLAEPFKVGYYNDLGEREKVYIQRDDNDQFMPAVLDTTLVVTVNDTLNQYYTYHENLLNVSDFLSFRPQNIAQSLIIYHPEFVQYMYCASLYPYTDTINNRSVNTFNYDAELANLSYAQASARFGSPTTLLGLFNAVTGGDPYFDHPLINLSYTPLPPLDPQSLMWANFQNFETIMGLPHDIAHVAYIQNTCGYTYPTGCIAKPDIWGTSTGYIHDEATWQTFIQYYTSVKQEIILSSMQLYGIFGTTPDTPAQWNMVVNNCIGNNEYFPYFDSEVSPGVSLLQNPCNFPFFILYHGKQRRIGTTESQIGEAFGLSDPPTFDELNQYATQGYYNETGNCPMVSDLEFLLARLAQQKQGMTQLPNLTAPSVDLSAGGYMGSQLFNFIDTTTVNIVYTPSVSGPVLTGSVIGMDCPPFELTLPAEAITAGYDFNDIQTLFGVDDIAFSGSNYAFTVKAIFYDPAINPSLPETLEVNGLTCLPLTGCEAAFRGVCKATPVAKDLMNVMSAVSQDGELFNTGGYTLTGPQYNQLITQRLRVYLGSGGTYVWTYGTSTPNGEFVLSNGSSEIQLTLDAPMTNPSPDYYQFMSISSSTQTAAANTLFTDFSLKAVQVDDGTYFPPFAYPPANTYVTFSGDVSVSGAGQTFPVTLCQNIQPLECNTPEHQNLNEARELFEMYRQGVPLDSFYLTCSRATYLSDSTFSLDSIQQVLVFEADMSQSHNGENSDYYRIVLKMNDNSLDTIIGRYCKPMRNCVPCVADSGVCGPNEVYVKLGPLSSYPDSVSYTIEYDFDCPDYKPMPAFFAYDHPNADAYWQAWKDAINASNNEVRADIEGDYMYLRFTLDSGNQKCSCNSDNYYILKDAENRVVDQLLVTCCQYTPPCTSTVLQMGPFPEGWFDNQNIFEQQFWGALTDSSLVYEEDSLLMFENRCQAIIRTGNVMTWDPTATYRVSFRFVPFETPDPVQSIQLAFFDNTGAWLDALYAEVSTAPQVLYFQPDQAHMYFGIDIQNVNWDNTPPTCEGSSKVGLDYLIIEKMEGAVVSNDYQQFGIDSADIAAPGASLPGLGLYPVTAEQTGGIGLDSEAWIEGDQVHLSGSCAAAVRYNITACPGYPVQMETRISAPDSAHAPDFIYFMALGSGMPYVAGPYTPGSIQTTFTPADPSVDVLYVALHGDSLPNPLAILSGEDSFANYCTDSVHFAISDITVLQGCTQVYTCGEAAEQAPCPVSLYRYDAFFPGWDIINPQFTIETITGTSSSLSVENNRLVLESSCAAMLSTEITGAATGGMYHLQVDLETIPGENPPTLVGINLGTSVNPGEYGTHYISLGSNDVYFAAPAPSFILGVAFANGYLYDDSVVCADDCAVGISSMSLSRMGNYQTILQETPLQVIDSTLLAQPGTVPAQLGLFRLVSDDAGLSVSDIWVDSARVYVTSACFSGVFKTLDACVGYTYEGELEIAAPDTAKAPSAIYIVAFAEGVYNQYMGPFSPGTIHYEFTPTVPHLNLAILAINSDSVFYLPSLMGTDIDLADYCSDSVLYYISRHTFTDGCVPTYACGEDNSAWQPWETDITQTNDCHPDIVPFPTDTLPPNECVQYLLETAQANADYQYGHYLDSVRSAYRQLYIDKCMAPVREHFDRVFTDGQYHYTLYYYDRAGNLVKTVPPHAVVPLTGTELAAVNNARDAGTVMVPKHNRTGETAFALSTRYRFNSLNQPIEQITPDGGKSTFYYDRLGRVTLSQNAVQAGNSLSTDKVYSYTLYDAQSRIVEVGQMLHNTVATRPLIYETSTWDSFFDYAYSAEEVTQTVYDVDMAVGGFTQNNLRSRVSSTKTQARGTPYFNFNTYYDYDIHGNVKALLNENLMAPATPFERNRVDYDYDLISGVVKKVSYNQGQADQYFHRYTYDDQNRLTEARTSRNDIKYDLDARYFYYWHGPLARTESGHHKVQGTDYAYTLQGWLKSLNSDGLQEAIDPGKDGLVDVTNPNSYFARDAYGLSLHYYQNDYRPIDAAYTQTDNLPTGYGAPNLFNGNIGAMNNTLKKYSGTAYGIRPLLQVFGYDQLNRIASGVAFNNFDFSGNRWDPSSTSSLFDIYATTYTYDPAGNLLTLTRNGDKADTLEMDSLEYVYYPNTNRLMRVEDVVAAGNYNMDVDDQTDFGDNYDYDAIGNLIKDEAEDIASIEWTVYGKVSKVIRRDGSSKPDLEFYYDAAGRRVMKTVRPHDSGESDWHFYYYMHDAQGNILSIYHYFADGETERYVLDEQLIYGSARLGSWKSGRDIYSYIPPSPDVQAVTRGEKRYEMNDHLGNVHTVVSDRKNRICEDGTFKYYEADIQNHYDYYAFGMLMPGRSFDAQPVNSQGCDTIQDSVQVMLYDVDFDNMPPSWSLLESGYTWYLFSSEDSAHSENGQLVLHHYQYEGMLGTAYIIADSGSGGPVPPTLTAGETYYYEFDITIGNCSGLDSLAFSADDLNGDSTDYSHLITSSGHVSGSFTANTTDNYLMGLILFGSNDTCTAYMDNFKMWRYVDTSYVDCSGDTIYSTVFEDDFNVNNQYYGWDHYYSNWDWDSSPSTHNGYMFTDESSLLSAKLFTTEPGQKYRITIVIPDTFLIDCSPLHITFGKTVQETHDISVPGTYTFEWTAPDADGAIIFDISDCYGGILLVDNVLVQKVEENEAVTKGYGYRFGFNGKEKIDEAYGEANAYDFGARIYDPRIGRWLSTDPLQSKYADMSPYVFSGNNPVLFVDNDGKDYGVEIDHTTGTITIVATIYTTTADLAEAQSAANAWISQSGNFDYVVGPSNNAKTYTINFKINVKDEFKGNKLLTENDVDNAWYSDRTGYANEYKVQAPASGDAGETANAPMVSRGKSRMEVAPGMQAKRGTGSHEIGHILGIQHWKRGLMVMGLLRPDNQQTITAGMIGEILRNVGIGKPNTSPVITNDQVDKSNPDYSAVPDPNGSKIISTTGTAPADFNNGEVVKNTP